MKNIKKSIVMSLLVFASLFLVRQVIAATGYTKEEVAQHNSSSSCWSIYDGGVYDITTYLMIHNQKYSDITSWCGADMTKDFDSIGKHRGEATSLLASFKIGTVVTVPVVTTPTPTITTTDPVTTATPEPTNDTTVLTDTIAIKNPYNLLLPLIFGIILYWGSLAIFRKNLKQFNAFWNTILLLTFLIPSFGFGIFMMLQYQFPSLMDVEFRFMYWHVEFSVFMGVLAISHFIRRLKIYLLQIKKR